MSNVQTMATEAIEWRYFMASRAPYDGEGEGEPDFVFIRAEDEHAAQKRAQESFAFDRLGPLVEIPPAHHDAISKLLGDAMSDPTWREIQGARYQRRKLNDRLASMGHVALPDSVPVKVLREYVKRVEEKMNANVEAPAPVQFADVPVVTGSAYENARKDERGRDDEVAEKALDRPIFYGEHGGPFAAKAREMIAKEAPREMVNHPAHYGGADNPYEVIKVLSAWFPEDRRGFNLGNAVKYIARADKKGTYLEDLKKARWYLTAEIERIAGPERKEPEGYVEGRDVQVNDWIAMFARLITRALNEGTTLDVILNEKIDEDARRDFLGATNKSGLLTACLDTVTTALRKKWMRNS